MIVKPFLDTNIVLYTIGQDKLKMKIAQSGCDGFVCQCTSDK